MKKVSDNISWHASMPHQQYKNLLIWFIHCSMCVWVRCTLKIDVCIIWQTEAVKTTMCSPCGHIHHYKWKPCSLYTLEYNAFMPPPPPPPHTNKHILGYFIIFCQKEYEWHHSHGHHFWKKDGFHIIFWDFISGAQIYCTFFLSWDKTKL